MTAATENDLIQSVDDLHFYLKEALKLEHATIPPYITALYSIHPGTNLEAFHAIRSVAVEEMLHLVLVANVLNAVGGDLKSTLTADDFVPHYPSLIPTGETDFKVGIERFSREQVETFCKIERAKEIGENEPMVGPRPEPSIINIRGRDPQYSFWSIGLFYAEIIRGMNALYQQMGNALFSGDPKKQITPEYYYNGSGEVIPVTDRMSAIRAIRVIQEQGEGSRTEAIYDAEREISHYYRYDQLLRGQYYIVDKDDPESSDHPTKPTGQTFTVDWDAVYPILPNAKLSDYPEGSELHAAAKEFQQEYSQFLASIEHAFNGNPKTLIPAVGGMFKLKEQAERLVKNPIPGKPGFNAAPIFRLD